MSLPMLQIPNETTPRTDSPELLAFVEALVPGAGIHRLAVNEPKVSGCLPRDCFFNAKMLMNRRGGDVQYGWLIWELPGVCFNAEFHAVWRSDGKLIDCTPQPDGEAKICFVPDARRTWHGRPVHPVFSPIGGHPDAVKYVKLASELAAIRADLLVVPAVRGGAMRQPSLSQAMEVERITHEQFALLRRMFTRG